MALKKELYIFLGITFAGTYGLQLIVRALAGPLSYTSPVWSAALSASMFLPAVAAIICMGVFRSKALTWEAAIIFAAFLLHAALFLVESLRPPMLGAVRGKPLLAGLVAAAGILALLVLHARKTWRRGLSPARLAAGSHPLWYLLLPVCFSAVLILTAVLHDVLNLGQPAEAFSLSSFLRQWLPDIAVFALILWPSYFGEEYGWRAYLQDRLFPLMGVRRGVLLLGLIWGLWHGVIVALGHNFPGYPVLGNLFMTVYCIVLGAIFSFAVLKTGSIWIAVLLHLINNKTAPVAARFLGNADNPLLGSAVGIVPLALLALVLIWLIRKTPTK